MATRRLKIFVACGGTGGHIFPGIATGHTLLSRGHDVTLVLAGKTIEGVSTEFWTGKTVTIPSIGLSKRTPWHLLKVLAGNLSAIKRCFRLLKSAHPDVLLAMGSYSSVGPVVAARACGIPSLLHESNAIPGRATTFLSRLTRRVALHFPSAATYFPKAKTVITGMPLRQAIALPVKPRAFSCPTLLIMGGSQGAHQLNLVVLDTLKQLHAAGISWKIIHLSGKADEGLLRESYKAAGIDAEVYSFTNEMPRLYAESTFAVCRSGAASCAELAACRLPALLVPYPEAARNHQKANADAMKAAGAADVIEQKDLTPEWLGSYLKATLSDPRQLESMRAACATIATPNGSAALADLVEQMAIRPLA